jgi:hypothetical protein
LAAECPRPPPLPANMTFLHRLPRPPRIHRRPPAAGPWPRRAGSAACVDERGRAAPDRAAPGRTRPPWRPPSCRAPRGRVAYASRPDLLPPVGSIFSATTRRNTVQCAHAGEDLPAARRARLRADDTVLYCSPRGAVPGARELVDYHATMESCSDKFQVDVPSPAVLADMYEDESSGERACTLFMQRKFADFPREKGVKELTEAEAMKLFHSFLAHLANATRRRLSRRYPHSGSYWSLHFQSTRLGSSSCFSRNLRVLFTKPCRERCSHELSYDLLPSQDTDVLRPDIVANCIQNRFNERYNGAAGGKKRTSKLARGPKRGCWVYQKRDHYAHEQHTREEVAAAKKTGKLVLAYAATLSERRRFQVLAAWAGEAQSSTETSDSDVECFANEVDVADVSDANVTHVQYVPVGPDVFNRDTASSAVDSAFTYSIASSLDARTKTGFRRLARRLTSNQQDFGGIVLDSAYTGASVISATEYERYCRDTGAEYLLDADSRGHVKFGNAKQGRNVGRLQSLGVARIRGYVDTFDELLEFDAHVIPGTDTPLLMSIQYLDSLGYDMRTGTRSLLSHDRDEPKYSEYPIGPHPFHIDGHGRCVIRRDYAAEGLFTEAELRNFHRSYGHKSAETIIKALKDAGFEDLSADTHDKLNDVARACDLCQRNAVKPLHYSISVKWKEQRLNHLVLAAVVHSCHGDLVYVIDHATRLNGAHFTPSLKNPSAPEIWNAIKLCFIDIYLGPPDILQVDQGRNVNDALIQTACAMNGIEFQSIPTEAPWRMGVVERPCSSGTRLQQA